MKTMECEKNPYIENFCRALIAKKGEKLEEEALERLVDSLYRLFENMLGRNMVAALPEGLRSEFVSRYDKGSREPDYQEIARVFEAHVSDPQEIMKKTAREFAELYFRNR